VAGMLVVERLRSRHLEGNLFGDPAERELVVYLPPSYERDRERRYPVAYLLHGFGARALSWVVGPTLDGGFLRPAIGELLDRVFLSEGAPELIVAMPDGWSRWGSSQWVDSPLNGRFERYVVEAVVAYVDARFRTLARPESRGVFGSSSGGFGAWHLASRHPEVFGAMALLSADSYFQLTHLPWFYRYYDNIFPHEPDGPVEGDLYSWLCYGAAACYSPNPDRPPHLVDLPVAFPTGELVPEVWERWLAFDPVVSWRHRLPNLRALRGILLDVGFRDEYGFHYGHRILARALEGAGIVAQVEEHDGTHFSRLVERIAFAVQWFGQVLARG
jgi:pimeloyl-ACP methyl ester carboxylesterase